MLIDEQILKRPLDELWPVGILQNGNGSTEIGLWVISDLRIFFVAEINIGIKCEHVKYLHWWLHSDDDYDFIALSDGFYYELWIENCITFSYLENN